MGLWPARSRDLCPKAGPGDVSTHPTGQRPCCSGRLWSLCMTSLPVSTSQTYTPAEMMVVVAARSLLGVRTVFVGVGLPNRACNLARATSVPDLELIYESGVYGARPARQPLSI